MSISIANNLRTEMDAMNRSPNWSGIASAAFRQYIASIKIRTNNTDMNAVIERLKAAKEMEDQQNAELGRQQGRKWAMQNAKPSELRRLEAARDPNDDWNIGDSDTPHDWGDRLAAIVFGEYSRGAFDDLIDDEFSNLNCDADFVNGFAEGCMEIWEEVKDEL